MIGIFSKLKISFVQFLKIAAVLIIVPPIINYAALKREYSALTNHGLLYNIHMGQKLFLSCKGEGLPTVIMESPVGINSDIYIPLQEKLSHITKVCVYDRAGLGLSERAFESYNKSESESNKKGPNEGKLFTIERMSEDLRKLISSSSDQQRPIMFVAAEYGSLLARFYANIYEDNISHLVLINPLVENLFQLSDGIWKDYWNENLIPKWYSYAVGSAVGLNRLLLIANLIKPQMNVNDHLTADISNRQKYLMCEPRNLFSIVDELTNLNESLTQMKILWNIKQFPQNISVTILTSKIDNIFMFQGKNSNEQKKLQQTWSDSIDFLKSHLHPSSTKIEIKESIYSQIQKKPEFLFDIISKLIVKWRETNNNNKNNNNHQPNLKKA